MKVSGIKYVQGRNSYSPSTKYGIAIHNTANDASAANEASYATRRTDGVSSHFYVDRIEVIQSLDTVNRAGHAGSSNGNYNAVAVEVTGVNAKTRDWWISNVNWDRLGYALAAVCKEYGISVRRASIAEMKANPKVKAFYSHNDMRLAWGGTTHTDPGDNFPWDALFQNVNKYMGAPPTTTPIVWGEDMALIAQDDVTKALYLCDGFVSRPITNEDVTHLKYLATQGLFNLGKGVDGLEWTGGGFIRKGWNPARFGPVGTPVDLSTISAKLTDLQTKINVLQAAIDSHVATHNVVKFTVNGATAEVV